MPTKIDLIMQYKPRRKKISEGFGQKSSTICPRCGDKDSWRFEGRVKQCSECGYDNFWERRISALKYVIKHHGIPLDRGWGKVLGECWQYIKRLREVK